MLAGRAFVSPLSVAFVLTCAAWATPQIYVGTYQGLFPKVVQTLLSFTICAGLLVWFVRACYDALAARVVPWRAIVLVLGAFTGAEIVWRLLIDPLGAIKLMWVAMLFLQPVVVTIGLYLLAQTWMTQWSMKAIR